MKCGQRSQMIKISPLAMAMKKWNLTHHDLEFFSVFVGNVTSADAEIPLKGHREMVLE